MFTSQDRQERLSRIRQEQIRNYEFKQTFVGAYLMIEPPRYKMTGLLIRCFNFEQFYRTCDLNGLDVETMTKVLYGEIEEFKEWRSCHG